MLVEFWQANAGGRYRHVNDRYSRRSTRISAAAAARSPTTTATTASARSSRAPIRSATTSTLAAGAHPFLRVRHGLRAAPDHPDVFRRRSADPAMTRSCATIPDREAREPLVAPLDMNATVPLDTLGLPLRHRAARHGARRCSRTGCRETDGRAARLSPAKRLADRRSLCAYRPDPASGRLRHLR